MGWFTRRGGSVLVVLGLLAVAGPALRAATPEVTVVELEEPVDPKEKERIARVIETMLAFHSRYATMPQSIELKIRLFRTEHHYNAHYNKTRPMSGRRRPPAAYYSPAEQEMVVHQQLYKWPQIMIHEAAHHVNKLATPRLPTWLEEGLATFFESGYPRGSRVVFRPLKHLLSDVGRWRRTGHLPNLQEFMTTNYTDFHRITEQTEGSRTYAVAYAIVYYMMSDAERRAILVKVLRRLRAGETNAADIFDEEYPGGLSRFQYDWNSFLRKPTSDVIFDEDGFTR